MAKRIGIPRALLYYKYYPFWEAFLTALGCEVVTSSQTTQEILQCGAKVAVDESCLPVKVFCGHVIDLMKEKLDYLFIPRIESVKRREFVCTKFLGLPDIVRNCIPNLPPILSPNIDLNRRAMYQSMFSTGLTLARNPVLVHLAYRRARRRDRDFERRCERPFPGAGGDLKIALIGHPYNIYDSFINMGIVKKLEKMNVQVFTSEAIPHIEKLKAAAMASRDLYWTYGREILGASIYFAKEKIDGIIFVISFPCGPDSLTVEYVIRQLKGEIPCLTLVIDEHRAEAGIITRLESFLDIVKLRKKR